MKRTILEIDEEKCTGCGQCITGCAEGALALVNGKAKLVKDRFCDGLGACLGECPTGALAIIEREAEQFDEAAAIQHKAQKGRPELPVGGPARGARTAGHGHAGCPGMKVQVPARKDTGTVIPPGDVPGTVWRSELAQWPVQLHLVPPDAPFFRGKDLVVLSTCAPVASPDVQWRFVRGRSVVVGCPKLDDTTGYAEKLAEILKEPSIRRVYVVRMEVPCCGGLTEILGEALTHAGRQDLEASEVIVGLDGEMRAIRPLPAAELCCP